MADETNDPTFNAAFGALGFADDDILQARLAEIAQMTGEEKKQAIFQLTI